MFALTSKLFKAKPQTTRSELSGLCALCESIVITGPNEPWSLTHGSVEAVIESARLACRFCGLLNVALDLAKMIRTNPKCRKDIIKLRMQTSEAKVDVILAGQESTALNILSIPGV